MDDAPEGWDDQIPPSPFGGNGLIDSLARWAAEAQVDEAAKSRSRERWLRQQAAEETTLWSVMIDLSERNRSVLVQSKVGRRHRGQVSALGLDFVCIRTNAGSDVLIARSAITAVRTQPREQAAHSGRLVQVRLRLHEAIAALVEDRPRVTIAAGPDVFNGDLVSVGQDVLTLRLDGDTRSNVYVSMDAVSEIALAVA